MLLYPKFYYKNVQSIDLNMLYDIGIRGIILDVDNTLIDYKEVMPDRIKEWVTEAKNKDFRICILSNSNNKEKVSKVAEILNLEYIMSATKPLKRGFKKAIKLLNLKPEECVAIGDQVFTDVIGANKMKIQSLYVEPISKKDFWYTTWKRPIEALILNIYKKKVKEN